MESGIKHDSKSRNVQKWTNKFLIGRYISFLQQLRVEDPATKTSLLDLLWGNKKNFKLKPEKKITKL